MNRRRLPLSEQTVRVERPCGVPVEQMQRLGRGRMHCASCGETVNVLWELSEVEARRVLRGHGCVAVAFDARGEVILREPVRHAGSQWLRAGMAACVASAPLWATGCDSSPPRLASEPPDAAVVVGDFSSEAAEKMRELVAQGASSSGASVSEDAAACASSSGAASAPHRPAARATRGARAPQPAASTQPVPPSNHHWRGKVSPQPAPQGTDQKPSF